MIPLKHLQQTILKSTIWAKDNAWQKATEMRAVSPLSWEAVGYNKNIYQLFDLGQLLNLFEKQLAYIVK